MFEKCSVLTNLDLSSFDTSKVTHMNGMFFECKALTKLNLSSFDTSKVTNMINMFYGCSALRTIKYGLNFTNTANPDTFQMFNNCPANRPGWYK